MSEFSKDDFYKRLYTYALNIVIFVEKIRKDSSSGVLTNQLLRSGTSVAANIFEAKSASSKKDYINFYNHALKSANESEFWIHLIKDAQKCDNKESEELLKETVEIAKILASSIITMRGKGKI
ncbi:MAG: four helix bundle protein [Patescibacteria group bacterium]